MDRTIVSAMRAGIATGSSDSEIVGIIKIKHNECPPIVCLKDKYNR